MLSPLDRLTAELSKLPGIGNRTALRLALHIVRESPQYPQALAQALLEVSQKIKFCSQCFHITSDELCSYCTDDRRKPSLVCVVEDSSDLLALEKSGQYYGRYHVLQGALSPLDGIGPGDLRIQELLARIQTSSFEEMILATNPTVTGDATALYLSKLVKPLGLKVTRLALGLPFGSEIEYVDTMTLSRALEARKEY